MKWFVLTLLCTLGLYAGEAFISAEKLNELRGKCDLVIIDVGEKKDYLEGHIPGAVHSAIGEWRYKVDKHLLMRPEAELVKNISRLGISNKSTVVIYGHGKPKELLKASYIALVLKVLGHDDVSILNGGFGEWKFDDDRKLDTCDVNNKPAEFKVSRRDGVVVDIEYVKSKLGKIPMIEARPPSFYFGTVESKGVKRKGHISGAMSYFWKNNFQEDETLKPIEDIKAMMIDGMQLDPEKEMLAYCTGGLEASMNWWVLTQVLGFKDVKIYDASLKQWGNLDSTPMVKYRWEHFSPTSH